MKEVYKDIYGCTASVEAKGDKYVLRTSAGNKRTKKEYSTYRGAKCAIGRMSDGWNKVN